MIFWRDCLQRFVLNLHLCVCLDLMHSVSFSRFMLLNATLWFTVMHTIKINGPKLANWTKWICITLWNCFCSLLTSNQEFNTGCLEHFIVILTQIKHIFDKSSYIDDIETNLSIGKHTLHVFTWHLKKIAGKGLFRCFIYVFVAICCISCHFFRFMLLNATLRLTVTHTFVG